MAKKGVATKVRLVTKATNRHGNPTGTTYYVKKGKNATEKLAFRKYDPEAFNAETGIASARLVLTFSPEEE